MNISSANLVERSFKPWVFASVVIVVWVLLYQAALLSAIRIWYISEIFSHGFFILPGALYLIWRERLILQNLPARPDYRVLVLLVPALALGVVGVVGGIQVFSHVSAFTVLPLAIWLCFGNVIAKVIWFPLCFILFSIPIGEELVPTLQNITADMAVAMLGWTHIPTYNTGLYIEIPQGRFVVAEACSGIRFFLGSLVFGAIYSHLTYLSIKRKVAFMMLSAVVPIVANAVRVFGIVVIGYYSDMEYATGADHLIYGWVFFSFVIIMLILLGETFKEKVPESPELDKKDLRTMFGSVLDALKISPVAMAVLRMPLTVCFALLVATGFWQSQVVPSGVLVTSLIDRDALPAGTMVGQSSSGWHPVLSGESDSFSGKVGSVDVAIAWFAENRDGSELISSANRLFDVEAWSGLGTGVIQVDFGGQAETVKILKITSSFGRQHLILYWYQLRDKVLVNRVKAKLYQTLDVLTGGNGAGALITFALPYDDNNYEIVREKLVQTAEQYGSDIVGALPF